MQIKLPVDVHLAVGDDGSFSLVIGGFIRPCKPEDIAEVLSSKPLNRRGRKPKKKLGRPPKVKPTSNHHSADSRKRRSAKGLCSWCDNKPAKGKKLCANHLVGARKAAEAARVAKKRAA